MKNKEQGLKNGEWILEKFPGATLQPLGGGCINDCYRVETRKESFFLKLNSALKFPGLFEKEKSGLDFLRQQNIFRIPSVIACGIKDDTQYILLEWIEQGPVSNISWENFGTCLARLHRITQPNFGFGEDNYMGSLVQRNQERKKWVEFFIENRIEPQLALAKKQGDRLRPGFEKLYKKLDSIFGENVPSALHGDLWSGNFLCSPDGQPVLIDPAVYFGHPSVDLGMTRLFGGFDRRFYDAYNDYSPLPSNHHEQCEVANLYPLLIHLNLFGSSYLSQVEHLLNKYVD